MSHTLDVSKLSYVFEQLRDNVDRLNSWECDRLEEWEAEWNRKGTLSDAKLECLEKMYLKVP